MARASKKAAAPQESTQTVTPEATAETTTSVEGVQLTISDLQLLSRIVDLASRRGAFQAGELSQVGDAYNKLAGFLAYVENAQKAEDEAKTEEPTAETTADSE